MPTILDVKTALAKVVVTVPSYHTFTGDGTSDRELGIAGLIHAALVGGLGLEPSNLSCWYQKAVNSYVSPDGIDVQIIFSDCDALGVYQSLVEATGTRSPESLAQAIAQAVWLASTVNINFTDAHCGSLRYSGYPR